ncbi:YceI family protein [Bdellovibrio sp. HCB209]|uniref:YceI family protein n=1 Tax=Bdellovibrio sp. HCB209 TaxID=3394354 RepID=UPI0039B3EC0A
MKSVFAAALITFGVSAAFAQSVVVDVTLNPMGDFKAKTNQVKGVAQVSGDSVSAQNIVVNMKSLVTGVELRDKHTRKYLEVDKHPTATLISATGKGGKGTGKIKIKGIEKDISGTYKIEGKLLKADFELNASEFGIKDINYMGVGTEDIVKLHVEVPVVAGGAAPKKK